MQLEYGREKNIVSAFNCLKVTIDLMNKSIYTQKNSETQCAGTTRMK